MSHITLLVSAHRTLLMGVGSLSLWVLANYWYLRHDFWRSRRLSRPHSWSVDMETKKAKGGSASANH